MPPELFARYLSPSCQLFKLFPRNRLCHIIASNECATAAICCCLPVLIAPLLPARQAERRQNSRSLAEFRLGFSFIRQNSILSIFRSCADLKSGANILPESKNIFRIKKKSFRIFFLKQARSLLSNAPRIIKIGSLGRKWNGLELVDQTFSLSTISDSL